jgi:CubicO group peptidase (beta-lactamase class C family)
MMVQSNSEKKMKFPSLRSVAILLSSLFIAPVWADDMPAAAPEDVGLSSERLERFSAEMEKGVAAGHFPGAVAAVARNGKVAFLESYGLRDKEAGEPMTDDTIFRIASMTKAITGVAVMILYEEGHFSLHDPIEKFIPAFKNARVVVADDKSAGKKDKKGNKGDAKEYDEEWLKDNWDKLSEEEQAAVIASYYDKGKVSEEAETEPANRSITIRDLLRHTAGISYNPGTIWEPGDDLEQLIDNLAAKPLVSHPGTRFEYGLSMDVLARLVEVVSGQSFDVFIRERIFDPLDMQDTGFWVPAGQAERLVKMKEEKSDDKGSKKGEYEATYLQPPVILMGGTGLVSTTMDYLRFCQMLLNNGELDGARILGRKAVELMRANHMHDVKEKSVGKGSTGEYQFGLTFGVKGKPGDTGALGSEGSYFWGGAYGTSFWIDPKEDLVGVFMVNGVDDDKSYGRMPYSMMLEHFTYQAIVD